MAEQLLQFDPGLMIWTIVVFVVTLLVLSKLAWGPLMKALDDREKRIHEALTKAERRLFTQAWRLRQFLPELRSPDDSGRQPAAAE